MNYSKNWGSRKAVISPSHVPYLRDLAEQTGINSLSEIVNYLIADYRKQQNTNTETNTSNLPTTEVDTSSVDNDDFGLGDLIN